MTAMPLHDPAHGNAPAQSAALARSILALPARVQVAVEDADHLDLTDVTLGDLDGLPTFGCPPDSDLARAAARGRGAVLTVVGEAPEAAGRLVVVGTLTTLRHESCPCPCAGGGRDVVRLVPDYLGLHTDAGRQRIAPAAFAAPEHSLNPGRLTRVREHANRCHPDLLRAQVADRCDLPMEEVLDARITGLTAHGLEITWIDSRGAHRRGLALPRPAVDADDLAVLLRDLLHTATPEA